MQIVWRVKGQYYPSLTQRSWLNALPNWERLTSSGVFIYKDFSSSLLRKGTECAHSRIIGGPADGVARRLGYQVPAGWPAGSSRLAAGTLPQRAERRTVVRAVGGGSCYRLAGPTRPRNDGCRFLPSITDVVAGRVACAELACHACAFHEPPPALVTAELAARA